MLRRLAKMAWTRRRAARRARRMRYLYAAFALPAMLVQGVMLVNSLRKS